MSTIASLFRSDDAALEVVKPGRLEGGPAAREGEE